MNEATYWRQRYEVLMATFADAVKAASLPPPPIMLADKESYEAGRIAGMVAQRKPWVGLTWDDMPDSSCDDPAFLAGAQWANSKLKEKNA